MYDLETIIPLALVVGVLMGAGITWALIKNSASQVTERVSHEYESDLAVLEEKLFSRENELSRLNADHARLEAELDEQVRQSTDLKVQASRLQTLLDEAREQADEKMRILRDAKEQMRLDFQNLANEILEAIKELSKDLEPYDMREHKGFLRNVMIRVGKNTDEVMVNIVTSREDESSLIPIRDSLISKFPSITSIVNNITTRKSGVSMGEHQSVLYGNEYMLEKLGKYEFMLSADSFFQTNTHQTEKLYDIVLEELKLTGREIVYDLFCGTGSISLYISDHAKMVYGFELAMSAVQDAMNNAIRNKVKNAWFFPGDLKDLFSKNPEVKDLEMPDVMIVDPPRVGLHANTIEDMLEKSPKRIVYVSCNPATQARDIASLCNEKYELIKLLPLDMFPHTPHVENVATLIRK